MYILSALFVVSFAYVVYLYVTAPEGYENEHGFHYGKKDDAS